MKIPSFDSPSRWLSNAEIAIAVQGQEGASAQLSQRHNNFEICATEFLGGTRVPGAGSEDSRVVCNDSA
eukprot:2257642-Rhodomonas_salina.1